MEYSTVGLVRATIRFAYFHVKTEERIDVFFIPEILRNTLFSRAKSRPHNICTNLPGERHIVRAIRVKRAARPAKPASFQGRLETYRRSVAADRVADQVLSVAGNVHILTLPQRQVSERYVLFCLQHLKPRCDILSCFISMGHYLILFLTFASLLAVKKSRASCYVSRQSHNINSFLTIR